uniref:Thioredoxin domain-containing protein n=1 Tax=Rhabditophanes sp. KR3021 TaxID=114890 RepID=A0AC35U202_9BILA
MFTSSEDEDEAVKVDKIQEDDYMSRLRVLHSQNSTPIPPKKEVPKKKIAVARKASRRVTPFQASHLEDSSSEDDEGVVKKKKVQDDDTSHLNVNSPISTPMRPKEALLKEVTPKIKILPQKKAPVRVTPFKSAESVESTTSEDEDMEENEMCEQKVLDSHKNTPMPQNKVTEKKVVPEKKVMPAKKAPKRTTALKSAELAVSANSEDEEKEGKIDKNEKDNELPGQRLLVKKKDTPLFQKKVIEKKVVPEKKVLPPKKTPRRVTPFRSSQLAESSSEDDEKLVEKEKFQNDDDTSEISVLNSPARTDMRLETTPLKEVVPKKKILAEKKAATRRSIIVPGLSSGGFVPTSKENTPSPSTSSTTIHVHETFRQEIVAANVSAPTIPAQRTTGSRTKASKIAVEEILPPAIPAQRTTVSRTQAPKVAVKELPARIINAQKTPALKVPTSIVTNEHLKQILEELTAIKDPHSATLLKLLKKIDLAKYDKSYTINLVEGTLNGCLRKTMAADNVINVKSYLKLLKLYLESPTFVKHLPGYVPASHPNMMRKKMEGERKDKKCAEKKSKNLISLSEETWKGVLEGEWMIAFHAPWCPACRDLKKSWNAFADWSRDLNVKVAEIDVTTNPGLSGRFLVTALPTIYHIKNGQFRQYVGPRDKSDLITFVEEKKWSALEPIPSYKNPDSPQMNVVAVFFKLSMAVRDLHQKLVEKHGLPAWVSYAIFGSVTLAVGCVLGFIIVLLIDLVFPTGGSTTAPTTTDKKAPKKVAEKKDKKDAIPTSDKEKKGETKKTKNRNRKHITESKLVPKVSTTAWPIVYSEHYNISCCGLEKLHLFDTKKWKRVIDRLISKGMLTLKDVVVPNEATKSDLMLIHTEEYLNGLESSSRIVSECLEIPPLRWFPHWLIDYVVLKAMRLQTGGTVTASFLALEKNWAINIGGGFHHASSERAGGFCVYADISLALKFLLDSNRIKSAMIVDLDAHQGNGHEHDFRKDNRVYIFDMFNSEIYPHDFAAKDSMDRHVSLKCGTEDNEYLKKLSKELSTSLGEFNADIIIFNAGTDTLIGDPLGLMNLTQNGIIQRDEIVFKLAAKAMTPILYLTSGGYTAESANVIADSIFNLYTKGYLKKALL